MSIKPPPTHTHTPLHITCHVDTSFNGTISKWAISNWMTANKELERMWKEVPLVYYIEISRMFPGWTEENHNDHRSRQWSTFKY